MDKSKIEITVENGVKELIIREGAAQPQPISAKYSIGGNVDSVRIFIEKMFANNEASPGGVIIINIPRETVEVETNLDTKNAGFSVTGKLIKNPALEEFRINTGTEFSALKFISLIRRNAQVFGNAEMAKSLIKSLQNFEVRFEQIAGEADDRQGNKEKSFKQQIKISKGMLPEVIVLKTPVFLECDEHEFNIEIELDRRGNAVEYSFYSIGYEDRLRTITKNTLQSAISDKCRLLFPVITQS